MAMFLYGRDYLFLGCSDFIPGYSDFVPQVTNVLPDFSLLGGQIVYLVFQSGNVAG